MSRILSTLLALAVLAVVVSWLLGPCQPVDDLGPGDELLGSPGAPVFLVRRGTSWFALPAEARDGMSAMALPADLRGRPALAPDGTLTWLGSDGVARRRDGMPLDPLPLPGDVGPWSLAGVDGTGEPVLVGGTTQAGLSVHVRDGAGWTRLVASDGEPARPAATDDLVFPAEGRAAAFRGTRGWEAWTWGAGAIVRCRAEGCLGVQALFAPDGRALIIEGRTDGLFRLELPSGRLEFMALGNLGASRRVPYSSAFRGDPVLLLAPQWDVDGLLQVFQTHLAGGGRQSLTTGGEHHYGPAVSHDGRRVTYLQARFDEQGEDEIEESIYVHDLQLGLAEQLLRRRGGARGAGPVFVGTGSTLVLLTEGRVRSIRP